MEIEKNKDNEKSREYWEKIEKTAREVENYPTWKRGESEEISPNKALAKQAAGSSTQS